MPTVLLVYATAEGQTRRIVEFIGRELAAPGRTVRIADAAAVPAAWLAERPDAVLVAGSVHVGQHAPSLRAFAAEHHALLGNVPAAFLSISLHAASPDGRAVAHEYATSFLADMEWQPSLTGVVAGALRYGRYGWLKRRMMREIARRTGLPTDTSRDHEFTDWDEVRAFTAAFAAAAGLERGAEVPALAGAGT